jgi:hypothetical protein
MLPEMQSAHLAVFLTRYKQVCPSDPTNPQSNAASILRIERCTKEIPYARRETSGSREHTNKNMQHVRERG